jgi:hypothetical protein
VLSQWIGQTNFDGGALIKTTWIETLHQVLRPCKHLMQEILFPPKLSQNDRNMAGMRINPEKYNFSKYFLGLNPFAPG